MLYHSIVYYIILHYSMLYYRASVAPPGLAAGRRQGREATPEKEYIDKCEKTTKNYHK